MPWGAGCVVKNAKGVVWVSGCEGQDPTMPPTVEGREGFNLLAKRFDAYEAEKIGLINKVVPKGKLEEEVSAWCKRILEMSPQSIRVAQDLPQFRVGFAPALIQTWPVGLVIPPRFGRVE